MRLTLPGLGRGRPAPMRRRGLVLQWHVTDRCDLRCVHCYGGDGPIVEPPLEALLPTLDRYVELLDSLSGDGPGAVGHVNLTGGEPLLHPAFPDLAARIAALRPRVSFAVLTNGTRVDEAAARGLARLGVSWVQVSVDGGAAVHDALRGAGSFDRAVAGIRNLVRAGVPTVLSFTASNANRDAFGEVARLGRSLGVRRVWSDRAVPLGSAGPEAVLDREATRAWIASMRQARDAGRPWNRGTDVSLRRALQFLEGGGRPYRCTAGDGLITVLADGTVVPCRRMPVAVGNVREATLVDLYRDSPFLRALREPDRVPEGCETCFWKGECRGGLRCLAHAVTGSPFVADPGCWLARPRADGSADGQGR